ncbi:aminotransferase class V-fold PLP-dependent enzyme [Fodinicola acaciae]|uniref:aminotransferase class V-fold PLP-dependent enzyme n=1 Tax=Fodinicola acaciae TaxID=2681555 RepID=UPI0013D76F31|nr:aminotransferase class V-fold PLP-dependent enzyme [Fodinicola acaciae]
MIDAAFQSQWTSRRGYLNTTSYGLPPRSTVAALRKVLGEWQDGACPWEDWEVCVGQARDLFALLVNVTPDTVATGAAVSQLLAPIAAAIPAGSRVVVPVEEFTSNLFPYLVQAHRGVEVVTVPAAELLSAIDERADVVAFSLVQSASGTIARLDKLLAACRANGALSIVDATQAVGWQPVDASGVDVLLCAAYKWLMAPRGVAFAVVRPEIADRIPPLAAGWYAGEDFHQSYYGPPLRLASDARRFDISPAWFCWVGAVPSMRTLLDAGIDAVHEHNVGLANAFRTALDLPVSDSAIVSCDIDAAASERLAAANVSSAVRAGRVRLAFHLYNTMADVELAADAIR